MTIVLFKVLMSSIFALLIIGMSSPKTKPWRIRQDQCISFLGYFIFFVSILTGFSFIWIGA